jgi:hypothetical protein
MSEVDEIREGIKSFLRDYAAWNDRHCTGNLTAFLNFDPIRADFKSSLGRYFVKGLDLFSFCDGVGTPPQHSPERETIELIQLDGGAHAVVETKSGIQFYEYDLRKEDGWKIASIQTFFCGSDERVKGDPDLARLAASQLELSPADDFPEGLNRLFDGPQKLNTKMGIQESHVEAVGHLEIPSGFLACGDAGSWWSSGVDVFKARVPAGSHPVEVVRDGETGCVAALRIRFSQPEAEPYFARAERFTSLYEESDAENSHVIGVDGGCISLGDAASLVRLGGRERERFYYEAIPTKELYRWNSVGSAKVLSVQSGIGDGGYAAFWEVSNSGKLASLIVDFGVLSRSLFQKVELPFTVAQRSFEIKSAEAATIGVWLRIDRDDEMALVLVVGTKRSVEVRIYGSDGVTLFDTRGAGCSQGGGETTYRLPEDLPERVPLRMELERFAGTRYEFATSSPNL